MDRETIGNVLFLTSLAALTGCAKGSGGVGPRPGPFVTGGNDSSPGDPWTDPIETSGGTSGAADSGDDEGGWPSEGETGQVSSGTDSPPPEDDGPSMESSGGMPPPAEDTGSYGSTGYDYEPPTGGDPCPALAQLYADCNDAYIYENEIELCNQARADAQSISAACGTAHAEYLACLSTLDCATLLQPEVPFACVLQAAATDLACTF